MVILMITLFSFHAKRSAWIDFHHAACSSTKFRKPEGHGRGDSAFTVSVFMPVLSFSFNSGEAGRRVALGTCFGTLLKSGTVFKTE